MSISQQLVRKLLKAHTASTHDDSEKAATTAAPKKLSHRKRTHAPNGTDRVVATDAEIMKWHTKMLRTTNREMAASLEMKNKSSKSNAAAYHTLLRRQEQTCQKEQQQRIVAAADINLGTARSSTSVLLSSKSSLVKIPTYNRERYEQESKEKKRMKLAQALEKWHSTNTNGSKAAKKKPQRPKKTIFG